MPSDHDSNKYEVIIRKICGKPPTISVSRNMIPYSYVLNKKLIGTLGT